MSRHKGSGDGPTDVLEYEQGNLSAETTWWGAFVIGLAGTILVTGAAPSFLTVFGASYIPFIIFFTLTGVVLCLLLAELSAMMPGRTGGSPSYAYPAYKERWPRLAPHINGVTSWMYWVGWMPVAPLNMILASFYITDRLGLDTTSGITPISTFIPWWTLAITLVGLLLLFVPAYMGIRFGTAMATILAVLSMIPLTFLSIGFVFNLDAANWSEIAGFPQLDGSGFFSSLDGHPWWMMYLAFTFPLMWTVIAYEAAACYIDPRGGRVRVFTIARLWGTGLGLPHPGLKPNKREMAAYEDNVAQAIRALKARGIKADGHIVASRKPSKSIVAEARRLNSEAIVMGADPRRAWLVGDFMWSQEPYRVRRRASVPTHLVGPGADD